MKKTQVIAIWFLPLIVIGGLFNPLLGYLVVAMMAFFLVLSFFKGRYWCWNLCPRGAFLDIVLSKFSLNRFIPQIFLKQWFRWLIFTMFLVFLVSRLVNTGGKWLVIGSVFVGMCILTTIISIILGILTRHRGWCAICPMGTLQEKIYKIRKSNKDLFSGPPR
ncbi:MAG: 4Fe-4S binding protein [Candidatus Omnitrophica bacterium]|nr:4Fe-4S binding protein [Candidatus Omnitrophota bacterium]